MRVIFVSFLVIVVDQLSKIFVKGFKIPFLHINWEGMYIGQRIPIIGDFFRLTFIENPGMAFGYDPGHNFKFYLSLFSLLASIGLIIYLFIARNQSLSLRISLAFILGGAAGNLIDRLFYGVFYGYAPLFHGRVVDFFDFDFINISILGRSYDRFPIFNVADAAVTIGVLILILFYRSHHKETSAALSGTDGEVITVTDDNLAASDVAEHDVNAEPSTDDKANDDSHGITDDGQVPNNKKDDDGEPDNGKEISV